MVKDEFGDSAQNHASDLHRQLEGVNRQIANIIDAITEVAQTKVST